MKAVIMAGGEGTRLRPLTCDLPKPMARLCGRPVIEYIIKLLSNNGINEAAITLRYLPNDIINNFPDSEFCGVKLDFVVEENPLGTAGGVLNAINNSKFSDDEDVLVISGDAMCDFSLKSAVEFHKKIGADATIMLSRVADPREYGLVVCNENHEVSGFVEKPGWSQAVTDAVNTGIYIINKKVIDLIPKNQQFDFSKDLFPLMLSKKMKLCGYEAKGYWCDIGDIGAYTSCQFEMLDGFINSSFNDLYDNGIYHQKSFIKGNYKIIKPVYIGDGVKIADYSVIGPYAVIDDNATIGSGTTIKNSVVLEGSYIGEHCELRGALVCGGASLKRRAKMFEGSVAGENSVVGNCSIISPGVRVWPHKEVEDSAKVDFNIKTGSAHRTIFDDEGIVGEIGAEITPEFCAKIGAATAGIFSDPRIGVCSDSNPASINLKKAIVTGIVSAGAEVCDFSKGFESMFNFAVGYFELDMGLFVKTHGNKIIIKPITKAGLSIGRSAERKLESQISTGDIRRCSADKHYEVNEMPGIKTFYKTSLLKYAPNSYNSAICVKSKNKDIRNLVSDILTTNGCVIAPEGDKNALTIHIDGDGLTSTIITEDGKTISQQKMLLLGCIVAFQNGENVALPVNYPRAIDKLAEKYDKQVLNYFECRTDNSDNEARKLAEKQTFVRDGLENALRILKFSQDRNLSLNEMMKDIPDFAVTVKAVKCSVNPGKLLQRLMKGIPTKMSEGIAFEKPTGKVFVTPLKRGTGIRITAEANDMETAGELCADMEREIQKDYETIDNNIKTI